MLEEITSDHITPNELRGHFADRWDERGSGDLNAGGLMVFLNVEIGRVERGEYSKYVERSARLGKGTTAWRFLASDGVYYAIRRDDNGRLVTMFTQYELKRQRRVSKAWGNNRAFGWEMAILRQEQSACGHSG